MSEAGKRTREVSPAEYEELQDLVYELVRERLVAALGAGGMWNIDFRKAGDNDSFFGETVAERLARDVASHIAPHQPVANVHSAEMPIESVEQADDALVIATTTEIAVYVAPPAWARFAPPSSDPVEPPAAETPEHSAQQLVA